MELLFRKAPQLSDKLTNHLLFEFGHVISQDLVGSSPWNTSEPFPIPCDGNKADYLFCPVTGQTYYNMTYYRKSYFKSTTNPRATINGMTSFLDLSSIYGITTERVQHLRTGSGGKLRLTADGLLPRDVDFGPATVASPGIYSLYVIFIRYHNILAQEYASESPALSDEEVFQKARMKTIAVYQSIIEEKYIPTLLLTTLPPYRGYNSSIHPGIDEFFAAVSFKYAHSTLSGLIRILDKDFQPTANDMTLRIRDVFRAFPPDDVGGIVAQNSIEGILRGLVALPLKGFDVHFGDDLNLWCDLATVIDVQRGRDAGIPSYNDARQAFGLPRMESMEELVGNRYNNHNDNLRLVEALDDLYDGDIDQVDTFVAAFIEPPLSKFEPMGPLFMTSIKDQFTRLRDGDRFWYKNLYKAEEYERFPTLSEVIKLVCNDMDSFPKDTFMAYSPSLTASKNTGLDDASDVCGDSTAHISLLGGDISLGWTIDDPSLTDRTMQQGEGRTIDLTLRVSEPMEGPGFLGVGWGKQEMKGAEIWFCWINEDQFQLPTFSLVDEDECLSSSNSLLPKTAVVSCCLTAGGLHVVGDCLDPEVDDELYYDLEVVDWCLSKMSSSVTIRAPVCAGTGSSPSLEDGNHRNCFLLNSATDFIVAYNPNSAFHTHGYQRRTYSQVDLNAGFLTQSEGGTADEGLVATHGVFMLVAWMLAAPCAIFIARFMKTRSWRLVAHVSLMGFLGGLMIPLLIGVEASVGATDKTTEHSLVGLILMGIYFVMAFAGRVRYLMLEGRKIGRRSALASKIIHMYGGYVILGLGWWNCYTGLVRIGPEDSYFTLVVLSSYPMGYDINIFGFIRKYLYFPYIALVVLLFAGMEIRSRRRNAEHVKRVSQDVSGLIFPGDDDGGGGKRLETMTMETFLEITKMGKPLCIVDDYVLDISEFMNVHPGGRELLRYASGSDVTEELLGRRDVDRVKHIHSPGAFKLLKTLVKAKLAKGIDGMDSTGGSLRSSIRQFRHNGDSVTNEKSSLCVSLSRSSTQIFTPARVVEIKCVTPGVTISSKPVILLRLSLPRSTPWSLAAKKGIPFPPSSAFTFRGVYNGFTIERKYTPIHLFNRNIPRPSIAVEEETNDNETYDFLISLIPDGQMSNLFLRLKAGKALLLQGPKINANTVEKIESTSWRSVIMICAGTGIAPMLQLIEYYLATSKSCPPMFLIWILKGPTHSYHEEIGLKELENRSSNMLKWVIIYSSSKKLTSGTETEDNAPAVKNNNTAPAGNRERRERSITSRISNQLKNTGIMKNKRSTSFSNMQVGARSSRSLSHNVRDMIVDDWQRQSRTASTVAEQSLSGANGDCIDVVDVEFDQGFWTSMANSCMTRHYDESLLMELLESINAYTRKIEEGDRDAGAKNGLVGGEEESATNRKENDPPNGLEEGESSSTALDSDIEGSTTNKAEAINTHKNALLAVSGSPHFEGGTLSNLSKLGFPSTQVITFHTAPDEVYFE